MATDNVSRRSFLATTAAAAATTSIGVRLASAGSSANDKIGVALIGCGGQGRYVLRNCFKVAGDKIALRAVCDIDSMHADHTRGENTKVNNQTPDIHKDYREVMDRKDIDVVIIGTPDHWHAPIAIAACAAGKDVYVEKPCSHTIHEGAMMLKAARKHNRIVQVGQQQRSDPHFKDAVEYVKGGELGPIHRTMTMYVENIAPRGIGWGGKTLPDRISEKDYDMWLGAAPKREFNSNRFHSKWRWFYDYGGALVADWNVHVQDIVQWALGVDAPKSVVATGLKTLNDNRETPDTIEVMYEFEGPKGRFFQRFLSSWSTSQGAFPHYYGTEFYGENGSLFVNRGTWEVKPAVTSKIIDDPDNPGHKKGIWVPRMDGFKKPGHDDGKYHMDNFMKCVESRKVEDLACDIEVGHNIAAACHLGNISYRLGCRKLWWDAKTSTILRQDGQPDKEANALLTKEYRKGYELPEV